MREGGHSHPQVRPSASASPAIAYRDCREKRQVWQQGQRGILAHRRTMTSPSTRPESPIKTTDQHYNSREGTIAIFEDGLSPNTKPVEAFCPSQLDPSTFDLISPRVEPTLNQLMIMLNSTNTETANWNAWEYFPSITSFMSRVSPKILRNE